MKNLYPVVLFLLSLTALPTALNAQELGVVVIEKGATETLKKSPPTARKLIIKGTLKISAYTDINIGVSQIVIDGGTLEIGTSKKEFQHGCNVVFHKFNTDDTLGLKLINGGSLIVHGLSKNITSLKQTHRDFLNSKRMERNIRFLTKNENSNAFLSFENAKDIQLSGILFDGLGTAEKPSISWRGDTKIPGYLNNSIFINSKNTDIILDGTSVAIENNLILSANGSSIICSPSGEGIENNIEANVIINSSNDNSFALTVYNPYQSITNNLIHVRENTNGIGYLKYENLEQKVRNEADKLFVFEGNSLFHKDNGPIEGLISKSIGIQIDDFEHTGIWKTNNNIVNHFYFGAVLKTKSLIVDDFKLKNNQIGLVPGSIYLQNSSIGQTFQHKLSDSKAIWVTDTYGTSAPKISNITIENYAHGIYFEGTVAPHNYFEKISFVDSSPIGIGNLNPVSFIRDRDGSFFKSDLKEVSHESMGHHQMNHDSHAAHHSKPKRKPGYLLFSKASNLMTNQSRPLKGHPFLHYTSDDKFGNLTVSTGFGLLDPVHEHMGSFETLDITNEFNSNTTPLIKTTNRHEVFVAANNSYQINLGEKERNLYDLSFEWEATPESWIILKIPYKHANAYGMRSFGSLIAPSTNIQELTSSNKTTYFIDAEKGIATIKLFGTNNRDELVLYSSHVPTEITLDNQRIPVKIQTDWKKNKVLLSYDIPERTISKIELLDYYGNVVDTLFKGIATKRETKVSIDLEKFNVEKEVYLYSLTVGNKIHKGPIHSY